MTTDRAAKPSASRGGVRAVVRYLPRPLRAWARRRLDLSLAAIVRRLTPLVPIDAVTERDVFIAGFPKSGHTWFQNIVCGVIYGVDPEYAPDTLVQELVPDVHYKRFYKRFATPMYFKTHHLPRPEYHRVIYLLRDGRDAMVSYYHYNRVMIGDAVDFRRMVTEGEHLLPCKWHTHVEAWLSNPHRADMLVVRYEDLLADPVNEMRRFCAFVGADRKTSLLEAVAAKTSFEVMREKERRFGWDDDRWPRRASFIRRGVAGSHKSEMPDDMLALFMDQARETLEKCGYL
ncbi:MAG: sulfotransferase domain-containing protein [Armatimonadota bacterium]|nr:sulfotransferase domain-containing protein [Armatimonadota bacterium]